MSFENHQKFIEDGTGQVFYLYDDGGQWIVARFSGGPDPIEVCATCDSKDEAETVLANMPCKPMT